MEIFRNTLDPKKAPFRITPDQKILKWKKIKTQWIQNWHDLELHLTKKCKKGNTFRIIERMYNPGRSTLRKGSTAWSPTVPMALLL